MKKDIFLLHYTDHKPRHQLYHQKTQSTKLSTESVCRRAQCHGRLYPWQTESSGGCSFPPATIHSKKSLTYTIETTDRPVNCFANQIVIEESLRPATKKYVLFQNKMRHIIPSLLHLLRDVVKPEVVNAIYCELAVLAYI